VATKFEMPRFRWSLTESVQRVGASLPSIVQITLAAAAGYSIARYLFGHSVPLLAVTVAITSLGFSRDARPRRVLETAAGMVVGIALSEVLLTWFGQGPLQMAITLLICLTIARFISNSAAFALTVGIQAMLVHLLEPPDGGVWIRSLDGLIGGVTALIFTAIIPRDPRRMARRDASQLFDVFLGSLGDLQKALRNSDFKVADAALIRVRRSQPLIDNWRMSLDSAISISRISPFLRKYHSQLRGQVRLLRGMDLATRNLRVVVRRVDFLLRDGKPRPYLADLFDQVHEAVVAIQAGLEEPAALIDAQEQLLEVIHQLDPKRFGIADQLKEASVLLLLRPMIIDLLCATGMHEDDARAELPEV
jgi:uncharacterized membrane protein YgaE (UPF0421/DUF939 family)